MAPHIGPHGLQENSISHEDWSASTEVTKSRHTSTCKLTTYPLCAACQFRKQRQWPSPGKRNSVVKDTKGNLKKDKLFAG